MTKGMFQKIERRKYFMDQIDLLFDVALKLAGQTQRLTESELTALKEQRKTLRESVLKIVIVGDYSRGKSSLLNALMGADILPTNAAQTTAINTFIRAVAPGEQPHIEVHFLDQRPVERLMYANAQIERWGTELDEQSADMRKEVERIVVYSDHELLRHNVELIDTPGLAGVIAHHEVIARRAMDEAHVAIWLMSADQLGGTLGEWTFLNKVLQRTFGKFLTVINKWDQIMEPGSEAERKDPREVREERARKAVIKQFEAQASGLSQAQIEQCCDERHLFGVSAHWAKDGDPEKRRASNVERLAKRIEEICLSGEGEAAKLNTPLKKLADVVEHLVAGLQDELTLTEESADEEKLIQSEAEIQRSIETLKSELRQEIKDAERLHQHHEKDLGDRVARIAAPINEFLSKLNLYITEDYIQGMIENNVKPITLPPDLMVEFKQIQESAPEEWEEIKALMFGRLEEMRQGFEDNMSKEWAKIEQHHVERQAPSLKLDIKANFDVSRYEEHRKKIIDIEQEEERIKVLENTISASQYRHESALREAEQLRETQVRLQHEKLALGAEPPVSTKTKKVKVERFFGFVDWIVGPKYEYHEVEDASQRSDYRKRLKEIESNRESAAQLLQKKLQEETQERISLEDAKRRLEKEQRDIERKLKKSQASEQKALAELAAQGKRALVAETQGQLRKLERFLNDAAHQMIHQCFADHLKQLQRGVNDQYLEPLQMEERKLAKVRKTLHDGHEARQQRIRQLEEQLKDTKELVASIHDLQEAVERV